MFRQHLMCLKSLLHLMCLMHQTHPKSPIDRRHRLLRCLRSPMCHLCLRCLPYRLYSSRLCSQNQRCLMHHLVMIRLELPLNPQSPRLQMPRRGPRCPRYQPCPDYTSGLNSRSPQDRQDRQVSHTQHR